MSTSHTTSENITTQNQQTTFAARAALVLKYGIPVMPLEPQSKKAVLKDWPTRATTDPNQIAEWNQKNPDCNCAAVGRKGGFWILDVDNPTVFDRVEQNTGHRLDEIDTLVTKSSGDKRHHYFKHDAQSEAMGNFSVDSNDGEMFSVRALNSYVVAPGSIHPDTKQPYEVVAEPTWDEIPVAPEWLMNWLIPQSKRSSETKTAAAIPETIPLHARNKTLTSLAGVMRRKGASEVAILAALRETNHQCQPPLPDAELISIAGSIAKYPPADRAGEAEPVQSNPTADYNRATKASEQNSDTAALTSITADQIKPKKIVWLWKNRFAQKLNMVVGNPDLGKGLITYYVASCITTGRDWFDGKNTLPPSEVAILSGEDDWDDTIVPRLMAARADLTRVHQLKMTTTRNGQPVEHELQLDRDAEELEKFLMEHPNVRLVIVDPISNYLGDAKMIDEQKVRADVLTPLKEIANRRQVAIIGVMHLNKKVELDAIHRIGGAMAFVGVARMVWLVAVKPAVEGAEGEQSKNDERLMVKVKGNIVHYHLKGLSYTTLVRDIVIEGGS